ncbi:L-carnitine dehydratase/bile acid-inducible protein F(EC:2.8.3.16) [Cronobacter malonaticus 681]|nr:L-carnitine dehydratase/bile acid-inducible protein F(EC:2.8.3.16) [Cronobacter malonaticus 681]
MVSDNAQRFVAQIGRAGDVRHRLDKLLEQIDFVVGVNVLQHRGDTLKAHTGIHGRLRQRLHGAVSLTVKLHKHDVPDLDIAIAIFFRAALLPAPPVQERRPRYGRHDRRKSRCTDRTGRYRPSARSCQTRKARLSYRRCG